MTDEQKLTNTETPLRAYKMTDADMKCKGYQFKLGVLHELDNDRPLEMCKNGFHFCQSQSGVWSYYSSGRLFEVECYDVLDTPKEAGADYKQVCRRIKFVKEVFFTGHGNTGYNNTGHRNTGNYNTGDSNTGYHNTGYNNTGDSNAGHGNTGYNNTGHHNTGHRNTGNYNTGGYNTGYSNTGHHNTGNYNIANRSSGLFNTEEKFFMFGKVCKVKWNDIDHKLCQRFYLACQSNEPFDVTPYLSLPNATERRLKDYHNKAIESRQNKGE